MTTLMSMVPSESNNLDMIETVLGDNNRLAEFSPQVRPKETAPTMDLESGLQPTAIAKAEGLWPHFWRREGLTDSTSHRCDHGRW